MVSKYLNLLKYCLVKDDNPIKDSIKTDHIYLADETGLGVNTKVKGV